MRTKNFSQSLALALIVILFPLSTARSQREQELPFPRDLIELTKKRKDRENFVFLTEALPNKLTVLAEDYILFLTPKLDDAIPPDTVRNYPAETNLSSGSRAERRATYALAANSLRAQYNHVRRLIEQENKLTVLENAAVDVQKFVSELITYAERNDDNDAAVIIRQNSDQEIIALLDASSPDPAGPPTEFKSYTWLHPHWNAIDLRWTEIQSTIQRYDFLGVKERSESEASRLAATLKERADGLHRNSREEVGGTVQINLPRVWVKRRLQRAMKNSKPAELSKLKMQFALLEQKSHSSSMKFAVVRQQRQELLISRARDLNKLLLSEKEFLGSEKADLDSQSRQLAPLTEEFNRQLAASEKIYNHLAKTTDQLSGEQANIEQQELALERASQNLDLAEGKLENVRKEIEESGFRCAGSNSLEQCGDSEGKRAFIEKMLQRQNEYLRLRREINSSRTIIRNTWKGLRVVREALLREEQVLLTKRTAWSLDNKKLIPSLKKHGEVLFVLRIALALNDAETKANIADLLVLESIVFRA